MSYYYHHPLGGKYKDFEPITYEGHSDTALDFPCPLGTEVYSMSNGIVAQTYSADSSAGTAVAIKVTDSDWLSSKYKNNDIYMRYLHLSELKVKQGDTISAGQLLGLTGDTGKSEGSHLHIDIYQNSPNPNPSRNNYPIIKKTDFKDEAIKGFWTSNGIDIKLEEGAYTKAIFAQDIKTFYTTSSYLGGTLLTKNNYTLPQYLERAIISDYMGEEPQTVEEGIAVKDCFEKSPACYAAAICLHEYNSGLNMNSESPEYNDGLLYSKLFRCWSMYPVLTNSKTYSNLYNLIYNHFDKNENTGMGDEGLFEWAKKNIIINKTFLNYAQLVYNNIKYPLAFGITEKTVKVGTSRLFCAAAGIWCNLSKNNDFYPAGGNSSLKKIGYKFKEPLSGNLVGLMYQSYWIEGGYTFEVRTDITKDFNYSGKDAVERIFKETKDKTISELSKLPNSSWTNIGGDWCAVYVNGFIERLHGNKYSNLFTNSSSQNFVNLYENKFKYYSEHNASSLGITAEVQKGNKNLINSGDVIIFDHIGSDATTKPNNNKCFDHIGIIYKIEDNEIYTYEGNINGTSWENSVVGDRIYTIGTNGQLLNGNNVVEQNFIIFHIS